jgi:hypothetical protein
VDYIILVIVLPTWCFTIVVIRGVRTVN